MLINIKNWGPVEELSLDSSKKLIVMCGPNNTGKTYVAYLINAVFSNNLRENVFSNSVLGDIVDKVLKDGCFELSEEIIRNILEDFANFIKKDAVSEIFAISNEEAKNNFKNFKVHFEVGKNQFQSVINASLNRRWYTYQKYTVDINKDSKSPRIMVNLSQNDGIGKNLGIDEDFRSHIEKCIYNFLISLCFVSTDNARMLTVERNSIYTFGKELSLKRSGFTPTFSDSFNQDRLQRYPMAINASLSIAEDLQFIQKIKGPYYNYAEDLESRLLNGEIVINQLGAIEFKPSSSNGSNLKLPIHMSSSIVKTMASLIVYLKHLAKKGDMLIIDEPEMNLHPDNQIILTRIFAELVNKGLKVMISTHSDYIIRELNNMVMAKEILRKKIGLDEGEVFPYPSQQTLSRKDMEVIFFNFNHSSGKVKGERLEVSPYGFDVSTIDKTITDQTNCSHFLADTLAYGQSEK